MGRRRIGLAAALIGSAVGAGGWALEQLRSEWQGGTTSAPVAVSMAPRLVEADLASLRDRSPLVQVRRIREAGLEGHGSGCCVAGQHGISCAMYAPGSTPKQSDTPGPSNRSDFVVANPAWKWPQPGGVGTTCTITYSFSNLLNGQMRGITTSELQTAVRQALGLWAAYAPLSFVEVVDSGPTQIADVSYAPGTTPNLRFGQHLIDGSSNVLAHAFYPFDVPGDGLSGDLHFDVGENWATSPISGRIDFLEVCTHEIGHALGLDHQPNPPTPAIMNPFYAGRFSGLGTGFLLTDDQQGIQAIYGSLAPPPPPPPPPATTVNVAYNAGAKTLSITGDSGSNSVSFTQQGSKLLIQGGNGTKVSLNGASATASKISISNVATPLTVTGSNLGAGNDVLAFTGLTIGTLSLSLADGNDRVTLNYCTVTTSQVNGGTGTDTFVATTSKVSTNQNTQIP